MLLENPYTHHGHQQSSCHFRTKVANIVDGKVANNIQVYSPSGETYKNSYITPRCLKVVTIGPQKSTPAVVNGFVRLHVVADISYQQAIVRTVSVRATGL